MCQWLLESFDLGSLCWLTFGGKSTECGKFKLFRLIAPKLSPLRRRRVNIGQIIKATLKQVKQGTVLRGPAGLAVFSCGIRLTPPEAVTDSCSSPKTQRNQALVLLVNKQSIQERYQF